MVVARGATATDQFALDSGLSIIIRSDGGLERFVIFSVLQCARGRKLRLASRLPAAMRSAMASQQRQ